MLSIASGALTKIALAVAAGFIVFALGLCGWIWIQSGKIEGLESALKESKQQVEDLNSENAVLTMQIREEKNAVIKQVEIANKLEEEAASKKEIIRYVLKDNKCANTALPNTVIDELRK